MKIFFFPVFLLVVLTLGCAHGSPHVTAAVTSPASSLQPADISNTGESSLKSSEITSAEQSSERLADKKGFLDTGIATEEPVTIVALSNPSEAPQTSAQSDSGDAGSQEYLDYRGEEEGGQEKKAGIADPLEPFNRAMYHVNDKLYFWVLKPIAQGYSKVVPEGVRVSVGNFFSNITFPIRFVNCLLQANFSGAFHETGRFILNTIWGIGGLLDIASTEGIDLLKQDADFGQTLGVYGVGQGFYINWPLLGPSSPRDTIGTVGDLFLHPLSYVNPTGVSSGIRAYDKVNDTSLRIGDYESLKGAAIDPYIAIRDAYVQYRLNKVKVRGIQKPPSRSGGKSSPSGIKETLPAEKLRRNIPD